MQGCGHIRVVFPTMLLNLARIPNYRFVALYSVNFVLDARFYKNFTFVQFQRSALSSHYQVFKYFHDNIRKQCKIPIIYEIDDLLMNIPEWNYAHDYYKENSVYIKEMMKISDGITTSTETLKKVYSEFNKNIVVIPNHLPKFLWGNTCSVTDLDGFLKRKRPRILYAGSENHFATKQLIKKGIKGGDFGQKLIHFIRKTVNDYQWVICGGFPSELDDLKNNGIEYHGWTDILHYPAFLKSLEMDICIAPLMSGVFNDSKSNIKMLEFTAIGCPGVYSKAEPYKDAYLVSETEDEFISNIERLVEDVDLRKLTFEKDYATIKDQLYWEDNDNIRKYIEAYLSLFGKRLE